MGKKAANAISPTRAENYPEWYQQVIKAADMAENSPVRGCMVIKPWGYGLWENIQRELDAMFKATGHKNAYFPLFIPLSFLQKEADHVEGFATECAVVTHHRLKKDSDGQLIPDGELEEPLIVRPTSETIIGEMFSKWTQSYRDLPLLINQWANVVRWEMRTRLFLRTAEFLWQEGHTVHATEDEAVDETMKMLDVYADFAENFMAMPVIKGEKTEGERFPGAVQTYSIEAMMQDKKALQSGTSHFLGQNFAKASDIQFLDENGERVLAWTTSWGVSTRLIGGIIMTHADDDGLVLPPRLAPSHIVILPVLHKAENPDEIMQFCQRIADQLQVVDFHGRKIVVEIDNRDLRGGEKTWSWIKKGIPIRLEVGPRDMADDSVFVGRRDKGPREKYGQKRDEFVATIVEVLDEMQAGLFAKAKAFRDEHSREFISKDEFMEYFSADSEDYKSANGGFATAFFDATPEEENALKKELGVTVRCIPIDQDAESTGTCIISGRPATKRAIFAKAY